MLPKDTYFEFSLTAPDAGTRHSTQANDFFCLAGVDPHRVVLTSFLSRARWSFYTRSRRELKQTLDLFARMDIGLLRLKVRSLGPKDWRDRWQLYFHTMPLGRKFTIVPLWEKKQFNEKRTSERMPLFLDPCGAFGSGAHETTKLMIRMMEPLEGPLQSFLDIGTGTGILAVAAFKLGAKQIVGVDSDPQSAAAARRNFKLNGGRGGKFRAQDIQNGAGQAVYQVVAANFISADLLSCRKAILDTVAPKGVLLLSGISLRNLPHFLKNFKTPGFRRICLIRGRSWAALSYRKTG